VAGQAGRTPLEDYESMIRVRYGVMLAVRAGDTVTAGSVASTICPLPK
jgi:hypothetical protein